MIMIYGHVNVRLSPVNGIVLTTTPAAGALAEVVKHMSASDKYVWWQVKTLTGRQVTGWVRGDLVSTVEHRGTHVLQGVPYVSQIDKDASAKNNDCGPASVLMLHNAYRPQERHTVDWFSSKYPGDPLISIPFLRELSAEHLRFPLEYRGGFSLAYCIGTLNSDRPFIQLLNASYLTGRKNKSFFGPHFLVCYGYTPTGMMCHDAYGWSEWEVPYSDWINATSHTRTGLNSNYNNPVQALYYDQPLPQDTPQRTLEERMSSVEQFLRENFEYRG